METTELILLLMDIPGIGGRTIEAVLRKNAVIRRPPDELLALPKSALCADYGLRSQTAAQLTDISMQARKQAEADGAWLRQHGVSLISSLDASYPVRFSERLSDPPSVLFSYGNGGLLNGRLMAIANSNKTSEDALARGDRVVEAAIAEGWTVVTGHNRIQYQRPALAARRN